VDFWTSSRILVPTASARALQLGVRVALRLFRTARILEQKLSDRTGTILGFEVRIMTKKLVVIATLGPHLIAEVLVKLFS